MTKRDENADWAVGCLGILGICLILAPLVAISEGDYHPVWLLMFGVELLLVVLGVRYLITSREKKRLARERLERLAQLEEHFYFGEAIGEVHYGYVSTVVEDGAFVVFDLLDELVGLGRVNLDDAPIGGYVHRSELSWSRSREVDPGTVVTVGERVRVLLMAVEQNRRGEPRFWLERPDVGGVHFHDSNHRYRLSIRRASWPETVDWYRIGEIVPAVVIEIQREFALLKLPGPVLGRANRTDVADHQRRGGRMDDVIAEGDVVPIKVEFVNHEFFRLNVSYREARSETSAEGGWVFDQRGRVMQVPSEAREAFPDECAAIEARYAARRELSLRPPF